MRCFSKLFLVFNGIVGFVGSAVPGYLQLFAALECSPGIVRNHGHTAQRLEGRGRFKRIDANRLVHSRNLQRFLIVKSLYFPAEDRRTFDRRVHHAIHARVHSKHRFSRAEFFQVIAGRPLPDVPPLRRLFELELFLLGDGKTRRLGGQFTVTQAPARRLVNHRVELR